MASSFLKKGLLLIILIAVLQQPTTGFVMLNTPEPEATSDPVKVALENVTFENLSSISFQNVGDVGSLKISNSKIGKIEKFAFDRFNHLNLLELSNVDIKENIHPETFFRLPGLEFLVLKNIGLKRLRLNLSNVQELIVPENEIEELGADSLRGNGMNYLDISKNNLKILNSSLEFLPKLSMIDISRNKISYIANYVFEHNANLIRILASDNKIKSLDGLKLPWLRTLDLFSNQLSVLNSNDFPQMVFLEELVLAFNKIKVLEDPFKDLVELKFLNLAWNQLEEIKPELFRNNLYLTSLSLQGNKLKFLDQFVNVHNHLSYLDLSHNQLTLISDDFFSSLPNLQVLDLSFNRLKTLTDILGPLSYLKVLNLAYNEISVAGYEFTKNHQLSQLNLSSNSVGLGLSLFENNHGLNILDLSDNIVSKFCDADAPMKHLMKISLRGNQVRSLSCLKKKFPSLCEVDIRNNPLTCDQELDDFIQTLVTKRSSPKRLTFELDVSHGQCQDLSLTESISLWNSVKRDLCPKGVDLRLEDFIHVKGAEVSDHSQVSAVVPTTDEKLKADVEIATGNLESEPHHRIRIPIGRIRKEDIINVEKHNPQSERIDWEVIEKNPDWVEEIDEDEEAPGKSVRYSWYTIALLLIVLSLVLTCFNIAVFMYIRIKVWRKSGNNVSRRYTFLRNEVYKNTTEPSAIIKPGEDNVLTENQLKNKVFSFGKINEFLLNFNVNKKDKDTESTKNILMG